MDLPSDLLYFTSQIQNYSRNCVKLQTLNQTTLSTKGATQLRLSLPVNAIVNMKSLAMHCKFQTVGVNETTPGAGNQVYALIPKGGIQSAMDRVSYTAGGVALDNGFSSYNVVQTIKENNEKSINKYMTDDRVTQQSTVEPFVVGESTWGDTNVGQERELTQNNWLGFSECHPCFLDMNLLPEVFVTMQISSNGIVPVQYAGTALGVRTPAVANGNFTGSECSYNLADIYFTAEVVSIGSGLYDALTERLLAERGSVDVPYRTYNNFSSDFSSAGGSIRGSVSTMSLDKMYGVFRNAAAAGAGANYDEYWRQQPPVIAADNTSFAFTNAATNFISAGIADWSFRLNNSPYPLYNPSTMDAFNQVIMSNGRSYSKNEGGLVGSAETWKNNCWNACVQLSHDNDVSRISGVDLRSINSQITLQTNQSAASYARQAMLVTESTSVLRIGPGRAVAVIA